MTELECQFCKHKFKNKSILNNHQKNAKYCLKIQGKKSDKHKCDFCEKHLSCKYSLKKHLETCNARKNYISEYGKEGEDDEDRNSDTDTENDRYQILMDNISELKKIITRKDLEIQQQNTQIINLQRMIENIAIQSTKNTNITINQKIQQQINQLQPVTDASLNEQSCNFTLEHFRDGLLGLGRYAMEYPLKDSLVCTDQSRLQFKWKDGDGDGQILCDKQLHHLTRKLCNSLLDRNEEITREAILDIQEVYNRQIELSEKEYEKDFYRHKIVDITSVYKKYSGDIKKLADGDISSLQTKFSNIMSTLIPKEK
jgi:hypothetical protein